MKRRKHYETEFSKKINSRNSYRSISNQCNSCLLYTSMATGTSVLCAQYWGKGDKKTVEKILGLAERISLIISLIFFVISFTMPTAIMKIFTNSPETIAAGSEYLKVISFSFVFMGFSQIFMSALRSIGKIMLPSVTYIVVSYTHLDTKKTILMKKIATSQFHDYYEAQLQMHLICLRYYFEFTDTQGEKIYYGNYEFYKECITNRDRMFDCPQNLREEEMFEVPDWAANKVVYQIFQMCIRDRHYV